MKIIPLKSVPKQTFQIVLSNQLTQFNIYTTVGGLFIDVLVNNLPIMYGTICQDRNLIVRDRYLGFSGDIMFFDTQGENDPTYDGLGSRYFLAYFTDDELL